MAKKSGSFFEKLKRGMGIEIPSEEIEEEEIAEPEVEEEIAKVEEIEAKKEKKIKAKKTSKREVLKRKKIEMKSETIEEEGVELKKPKEKEERPKEWFQPEGQLSVDVYQTGDELVIQSAIAGVRPEDLDISLQGDVVSIRGVRERPFEEEGDYFTQECYWGPFSREVILPVEVDPNKAEASMKNGVLTIRIPKILREKRRKIIVKKLSE